jgi:chloramphenicol 3-O phosphotransferase
LNTKGRIVLLNGVGSVGKTSIARELQKITHPPFLHVQLDTFMDMLPETYHNHPDGFSYETVHEDGKPLVIVRSGIFGELMLRGMRRAIAGMAGEGNNIIVDDVMLGNAADAYRSLLSEFETFLVGVFAPLEVIEERERRRGDRHIGLGRWQYDRVHRGIRYDLEVDATTATPTECAQSIKSRFNL